MYYMTGQIWFFYRFRYFLYLGVYVIFMKQNRTVCAFRTFLISRSCVWMWFIIVVIMLLVIFDCWVIELKILCSWVYFICQPFIPRYSNSFVMWYLIFSLRAWFFKFIPVIYFVVIYVYSLQLRHLSAA